MLILVVDVRVWIWFRFCSLYSSQMSDQKRVEHLYSISLESKIRKSIEREREEKKTSHLQRN